MLGVPDGPTHDAVMYPKVLHDCLHGVRPRQIGRCQRGVPIAIRPGTGVQRRLGALSLHLRNVIQGTYVFDMCLHPRHKLCVTQGHLVLETVPDAGLRLPIVDKRSL